MPRAHRPFAAALWMLGAVVAFTAMAIAAREVSDRHDTFEIMAWRSAIGFGLVMIITTVIGKTADIRTDHFWRHVLRNLFHFTGQNLWFWALALIPLAQVFALEFTSPIWVILLSPLLLGEKLNQTRVFAAALGFAGILIVARPDFTRLDPGVLAAAASAVFFATTVLMTKSLTRGETIVSILFWLTLMQFVFATVLVLWDGKVVWPDAQTLPWLVVIGFAGVLAHLCLTSALSLAPASFVVPFDFIRLPVIAIVGAILYSEAIDIFVILGGAVIFCGNLVNVWSENRARAQQKQMTKT